jgi:hypothetical protein
MPNVKHTLRNSVEFGTGGARGVREREPCSKVLSKAPKRGSLVLSDQGGMRFVKYVHGTDPGSRWDVSAEYETVKEEDGEEEGKK